MRQAIVEHGSSANAFQEESGSETIYSDGFYDADLIMNGFENTEDDWTALDDEDFDEPTQLAEASFFRKVKVKALIA